MGGRGSGGRPRPTHLKLIDGNPGKRALNRREPQPIGELPPPPRTLNTAQRHIWRRTLKDVPPGLLRRLDWETYLTWVIAVETRARAVRALETSETQQEQAGGLPLLRTTPNGHLMPSPYLAIINRQAAIILKCAAEMGFTPSSRSRIAVEPTTSDEDAEAAKYLT
jgi:P27 family predicted phage terminase small subunit